MAPRFLPIAAALTLVACGGPPRSLLRPVAGATPFDALGPPLSRDTNIQATPIERGEHASVVLVQIRDRETPHVHTRYDLTVILLRGAGTLWLDRRPLPMREGDVAFVPKGTPHFFVNGGGQPATALVGFAPPFDGPDQQTVEAASPDG